MPRATSLTLLLTCWHAYYLLTYLPPQGRQARRTRGQPELLGRRPRAVLGTLPEVCGGGARLRASSEVACLESPTGQLFEWVEALFVNVIVCGLSYGCGRSEIAKRSAFVIIGAPRWRRAGVTRSVMRMCFALLAVAHTAGSYLAAPPRVCTAARRRWLPRAGGMSRHARRDVTMLADDAVLACEQEVTRAFAAVNSAPADADKTDLLRQLKDAQDAVAAMRADRERERCARA